jgi:hypothetical protein
MNNSEGLNIYIIERTGRLKVKDEIRYFTFYPDDPTLTQHAITKAIKTLNLDDADTRLVISQALSSIAEEYEKRMVAKVGNPASLNSEAKVYEVVVEDGEPIFAVFDGNEVKYTSVLKGERAELNPLWLPYNKPIDYKDDTTLYNEIKEFFRKYLWLKDERYYDVLTCFVLATYRVEDFDVATYLFFFGPYKSGKSRALELLQLLCYRGIKCENTKLAGIYYLSDKFKPTHLYDETQKYNRREHSEIIELLDSGQRRPGVVVRLEKGINEKFEPHPYEVFGFKALAGRDPFHRSLTSRCIIIHMRKAPKRMPKLRYSKAAEEVKEIRSKLLMYRFKSLGKSLTSVDDSAFMDDRNAEIFEPLLTVAPDGIKPVLLSLGKEIEDEEAEEEKSGFEAQVLHAFFNVRKGLLEQSCKDESIEPDKISIIDVAKELSSEGDDPKQLARYIGRTLSRFGFKKVRIGHKGIRGYRWDDDLAKDLASRYLEKIDLSAYILNFNVSNVSMTVSCDKPDNKAPKNDETVNQSLLTLNSQNMGICQKCGSELKGGYFKRNDGSLWCLECMRKEYEGRKEN